MLLANKDIRRLPPKCVYAAFALKEFAAISWLCFFGRPLQPPWNHFLYLWTFAGASSMYARLCLFGVGLKVRCEMWSQHIITMTQWQSLQRHRFAILRATLPAQGPSKKAWGSGIPSASLLAPQHMRTSTIAVLSCDEEDDRFYLHKPSSVELHKFLDLSQGWRGWHVLHKLRVACRLTHSDGGAIGSSSSSAISPKRFDQEQMVSVQITSAGSIWIASYTWLKAFIGVSQLIRKIEHAEQVALLLETKATFTLCVEICIDREDKAWRSNELWVIMNSFASLTVVPHLS